MSSLPRSIALVLVAALVLLSGTPLPNAATAAEPDLGISSVAAATPADGGGWWVLERSLQDRGGVLHRYTADWKPTGETHELRLATTDDGVMSFSPTDIIRADDDTWWVIDDGGRVHEFSADFTHTGVSRGLRPPNSEYNASSAYGIRGTTGGDHWVAANRDFWRADEEWEPVDSSVTALRSGSGGYPVAVEYGSPTSLWVLEGYLGSGVSMYPLMDGGERIDTDESGSSRTATALVGYELEIPDTPVDIVDAGRHWWIVDADGQVHRYDRYWRYTGTSHSVGSGDAVSSYPSDVVSPLVLLVPILGLVWLVPGAITVIGLWWRRSEAIRTNRLGGGAGALLFVYGVVLQPHALRPIVFANVHLPLVIVGAALVLPVLHVSRTASNEGWYRAKPLVIAYAPVILGALAMVGPATRPMFAPY